MALFGCSTKSTFTKDTFPKIDGSTVTIPLSVDAAAELLSISQEEAQAFIKHNRTHQAYLNLLSGDADLILVTEPSAEELQKAEARGIELEIIPVVKDAFVFIINIDNPVDGLSLKEIQDIYQGKILNWKEVGGKNKIILPYQRPQNSGSQTLMENLVMRGLQMLEPTTDMVPGEMGELIERIAGYDNSDGALGYSVYYYANTMYNKDTMKFIAVDNVFPNKESIVKEEYPLTIAYYAVIKKSEAENSPARKYLKWLLSQEGQRVAEKSGYVPIR